MQILMEFVRDGKLVLQFGDFGPLGYCAEGLGKHLVKVGLAHDLQTVEGLKQKLKEKVT